MTDSIAEKPSTFEGLGINDTFMQVLAKHKFVSPTPIQHKAIPAAIAGDDVIGIAQTGTGKTLAFGIPMMQQLYDGKKQGIGLVILPTRELAIQVEDVLQKLGKDLGLRTAVLIGGESMRKQVMQLRGRPHILIVTPGRLLDLIEQGHVKVDKTSVLVLDEADRMLDMGFAPQINKILGMLPKPAERQTMLFSATMPDDIVGIANKHMRLPVRVEVAQQGTAAERVEQELYIVRKEDKMILLGELLKQYTGSVLLFSRTKHGATKIAAQLIRAGHKAAEIHANKSLAQRIRALEGFKRGTYRVLVATDIAARGIDVTGIELVINFDLPDNSSDYVHRIGRTGRAGREGRAISFAAPDQRQDIRDIERLIRKPLAVSKHALSVELPAIPASQRGTFGGRKRSYPRRPRFNRR
jgi:ATP-dependent RNA helicase RhlE